MYWIVIILGILLGIILIISGKKISQGEEEIIDELEEWDLQDQLEELEDEE